MQAGDLNLFLPVRMVKRTQLRNDLKIDPNTERPMLSSRVILWAIPYKGPFLSRSINGSFTIGCIGF
jgi:hypothetical protein